MEKHKCENCHYCKMWYSSWSDWSPVIKNGVCTADDEQPRVDVNREHFCEKWKEAENGQ